MLALAALALAFPSGAKLVVMHGYADYTSALLWIQADTPGPIEIAWRAAGDAALRRQTVDARAADDNVALVRLTGLTPGGGVTYVITGDGDRREGALTAQPRWPRAADAQDLAIAIGSCFYLADADPRWGSSTFGGGYTIFDAIAARKPDVMIWMGDNLYFQAQDELDPVAMAARYRRQRAFAPLQTLLTATTHLAIWDDHDYGPNDADLSYAMKGESLALFRRYWANPDYGEPDVPGVFGYARWGDVAIFLLDDRWYRTANRMRDTPAKTMFGARQLEWLKNALVYSSAPVKLVVNGSQLWNRSNRFEGWNHFAHEQKAFADWLLDQQIDGLVFLSGDRHYSELLRVERPGAYPLYEFTSSPLTSRPANPPGERDNPDLVAGTYASQRQFGMIRLTGPGDDRTITLESYDERGALLWHQQVKARDLRHPRSGTARE